MSLGATGTCNTNTGVETGSTCQFLLELRLEPEMLSRPIEILINIIDSGIKFSQLYYSTPITIGSNYAITTQPVLRSSDGSNKV